jgi:hypothetical protein
MNEEKQPSLQAETITLRPSAVPCFNFKKNGLEQKRTAIICPVRFKVLEDGSHVVIWRCSNAQACEDPYCLYAKVARNRKRDFVEDLDEEVW